MRSAHLVIPFARQGFAERESDDATEGTLAVTLYTVWIFVLYMFIVGIAAGWFGWVVTGKSKALTRENRKPNYALLLVLGLAGSLVGGLLSSLLRGNGFALSLSGFIASAIGAVIVVAAYVAIKSR